MPDNDEIDSCSESDRSHAHESDLDDTFDVLDDVDNADDNWTYVAHSSRGAKMFEGLRTNVMPSNDFQLEYNLADPILLEKTKVEVKHSLFEIRKKLDIDEDEVIDHVDAFAGAMPEAFLMKFFEWLKAGHDATHRKMAVSFLDIIEFLRCEILLRVHCIHSSQLTSFGGYYF